jgi:putative redox protein
MVYGTEEVDVVSIDVTYDGELHCSAVHGPSQATLSTDAPRDNQGKGEAFSPTDLVATGLATCIATTLGIVAQKRAFLLDGMRINVEKHMTASPPRRIERLSVSVSMPATARTSIDTEGRALLEHTAHTCPVRLSLLDAIDVPIRFHWE